MMICKPKRIHPIGVILTFIKRLKDLVLPAIFILFVGSEGMIKTILTIGFIVLIFVLLVGSFFSWMKFTYRIEEGEIRIEYGIFVKKKRYIPIERIQNINESAGIIQRLFKLVKVEIETAGGGMEAEVGLAAIRREDADLIREVVSLHKKGNSIQENDEQQIVENTSFRMRVRDLIISGSTSSGVGVVLSAGFALVSQLDDIIPLEEIFSHIHIPEDTSMTIYLLLGIGILIIAWILSMVGVLIKYAFFTVKKVDDDLIITSGLLEKRQSIIPKKRIQAIRVSENVIRQLFGYATVYIESAGGNLENPTSSTMLFPIVKKKLIPQLISEFTPEFTWQNNFNKLPKRSMRRYMFRAVMPWLIIAIPLCIFLQPWGYFSLFLILLGGINGYFSYKDAGWSIVDNQLVMCFRKISKTTVFMHKKRMQLIEYRTSFFQKRAKLQTISTTIKAGIAGSRYLLKDVEEEDVRKIEQWYRVEK
ncbi:PH domain-containing protein [Metabacillus fastidiosus]|uniref:PH domain-containing protein n=1 Tax=Metabacillus fastidiosus TaxID=1458 RepID=UPI002E210751|nr:PH domain-containing protein [Metabacillus fastidiosus]